MNESKKASRRSVSVIRWAAGGFLIGIPAGLAATLNAIDFKNSDRGSEIFLKGDAALTVQKQENAADRQIILDLKGATLSRLATRKIDTSSFDSPVAEINPYSAPDAKGDSRVVVQLRSDATSELVQEGKQWVLRVKSTAAAPAAAAAAPSTPPASDAEALSKILDSRETREFSGRPVTLQVRDADVHDVLRLIGDASGFNIVVAEDVKGKLTLSLSEVPWDQALDLVLRTLKLGAERNQNVLRVTTLASLTDEKRQEILAKNAAKASTPTVTKVFPISFADPMQLADTLRVFGSSSMSAGGNQAMGGMGGVGASSTLSEDLGKVSPYQFKVDKRTNSIIVQDLPENVEKIAKLVQLLDTQTPQVLIEAKVVEATEGFGKSFGGTLGFGGSSNNNLLASFNGANPLDALVGSPGVFAAGSNVADSSKGGSLFGISPKITFLPGVSRLNAILNLAESESAIKVISSPKMVVLNKETATVKQSTPVAIPQTTVSNGVSINTLVVSQAEVGLTVTPTVTAEGSVQLELTLNRGVPFNLPGGAGQAVANRDLKTKVLVDNGSTLVIGGVYTSQTNKTASGFPFLRKIPFLGALFGSETEDTTRTELFFFITPKVLNAKEAGMGA